MDWPEALESVIARTTHERYRALCAGEHPEHDLWRARILELAGASPPSFPPLPVQAGNFAAAASRAISAFARGDHVWAAPEEIYRRASVCAVCPRMIDGRCELCGCFLAAKIKLATETCPDDPDRWQAPAPSFDPRDE